MRNKTVRIFDENMNIVLTDEFSKLKFLKATEEGVENRITSTEIKGVDGVIVSPISFGPFNLVLSFFYRGSDVFDYKNVQKRLRGMLHRRTPFYITHSDMPGVKYAVYCEENSITDMGYQNGTFDITFIVFKGYSESLMTTDDFSLNSDYWQFGNGLVTNQDISYVHTKRKFKIFNGSSDTITPIHRHHLIIKMNVKAPNGFILHNKTTGDKFEYKKAIRDNDTVILNGVYPFKNKKRCGIDTNWEYITLAPGYNDFEVLGDGIIVKEIKFTFNYVYR
ncbi:phage tail domain-containing protein [Mammaliicoccus sciuri]|uniref:phage tail domain-containing protein n=1 Tax=Mammaliicoccus sciuri TaxID=1296 RepID=UPI001A97D7B8|nr:phage tail domain-containing protein [Mammaliicoccus sciuri]MBO1209151.1 phage tail family protein [Mammaliicoccus sciuri]